MKDIFNQLLLIDANYLLVGLIVIFYLLEHSLTTQFGFDKRPNHFFHNLVMVIVFMIANIFWAFTTVASIGWLNERQVGLLFLFDVPIWLKLVLGVVLYDLVTYWFHRLGHIVPVLWRFHRVHHSDNSMDSTTPLRAHPFELMFWFGSGSILAAGIFGLDLFGLGVYFLVLVPFQVLEHSNIRFPTWMDKTVGLVITTPNLHKIHHDQDQYYTDSNFADIFILWDRIFGTFKYKSPDTIRFGLKEFAEAKKQTAWFLLRSPFISMKREHPVNVAEAPSKR